MIATTYAIPDVVVFVTSTMLILVGAVGVISVKNPVHAALSLIMTLFGVAVAFIEQSADFLAAVQIIVYAGAIVVLFLFGAVQLGIPYWLMARGLRSVSAPEAGALTLVEPILTPVWTWLIAGELPQEFTYIGGVVIVAALAYRYWPARRVDERSPSASG